MGKLFLNCDEANRICDKSQYHEASFFDKIKLTIHLIYCSACRLYSKNNAKLTNCISKSQVKCIDESKKKEIKKKIEKELIKNQN